MKPSRLSRILDEWSEVSSRARRPEAAPRPAVVRNSFPVATLAGAIVIVLAVVAGGVWLGRHEADGVVGSSQSAVATGPSAAVSTPSAAASSPSAVTAATASPPRPTPQPTPQPTVGPCSPNQLSARITLWNGAAGSRGAQVELKNTGAVPCLVEAMDRPQLVDGHGSVLIDGPAAGPSASLTVAPGGVLQTLVVDSNYCGPTPTAPVTVRFVLRDGHRITAAPLSPSDATVPPCNGAGAPSWISMRPWSK